MVTVLSGIEILTDCLWFRLISVLSRVHAPAVTPHCVSPALFLTAKLVRFAKNLEVGESAVICHAVRLTNLYIGRVKNIEVIFLRLGKVF